MTILLAGTVTAFKIVNFGWFNLAASTVIFPLSYALSDIVTEVYGYAVMRQLLWFAVICGYVFLFFIILILKLPSPSYWHLQNEFNAVFKNTWRFTTVASVGMISSLFLNSYAIAKWKILMKGKSFWLRSLGATSVGDLLHILIVYPR
jgi:uncharacterized integral membrane protein (TIGR00697 family)